MLYFIMMAVPNTNFPRVLVNFGKYHHDEISTFTVILNQY